MKHFVDIINSIARFLGVNQEFRNYIYTVCSEIPDIIYWLFLITLFSSFITLISLKGLKDGVKLWYIVLLLEYLFILVCAMFFLRNEKQNREYNFYPFWSYEAIMERQDYILPEIVMNFVVFMPVGFLMSLLLVNKSFLKLFGIGLTISASIEFLQFIFKRGFCEIDDVVHNTVGFIIGCLICFGIRKVINYCLN